MDLNIIFLASVVADSTFKLNRAVNPASTKWMRGFLLGLTSCGQNFSIAGHRASQLWPKGEWRPGHTSELDHSFDNHLVTYFNLPRIREASLAKGYSRVVQSLIETSRKNVLVTYNPYPWNVRACRDLRAKYSLTWINMNLDFKKTSDNWSEFTSICGDADGHVFLSQWGFTHAPVENKLLMEGGVDNLSSNFGYRAPSKLRNIVYLGLLDDTVNYKILVELPALLKDSNLRFRYGGKSSPSVADELSKLSLRDSRVEFLGFVEESALSDIYESADIFLSPRDDTNEINDMVFPSKILQYLRYGRPVVGTWTKGFHAEYKEYINFAENNSARCFADEIQKIFSLSDVELKTKSDKLRAFVGSKKSWKTQAGRFREYVSQTIN